MNSYLIIKVEGKIIEKFILRCKKNNINLLKIERISNKEIIIKINSKDYENLNKIKSIYTLTIINNEGYLKFKEELNKRPSIYNNGNTWSFIFNLFIKYNF